MTEDRERGRESYRRRAWADAYRWLSLADQALPLGTEDLEWLATSAYLVGRDEEFHRCLERAYHAHLQAGRQERAARCGFWLGLTLLLGGEAGQAGGWLARAQRLVEGRDCVECGYLLLPLAERQLAEGDGEAARATAAATVEIGERHGDADLLACARHVQGRALIAQAQVPAGLALLDEAMLAVVGDELSPIMTGLIYCSVIDACRQVLALGRAQEWTAAMARWCGQQPELVAFTRTCLAHRAEIMQFHGDWPDAIAEARRACERYPQEARLAPPGEAYYWRISRSCWLSAISRRPQLPVRTWRRWRRSSPPTCCRQWRRMRKVRSSWPKVMRRPRSARCDARSSCGNRLRRPTRDAAPAHRCVLSARELQVLRLVATGKTNKSIAAALSLSERTIDRHVSNILTKLDVPSRAAATAYAYDHKLF